MPKIQKKMTASAANHFELMDRQKNTSKSHKGDDKAGPLIEKFLNSPNTVHENLKHLYIYLQKTKNYIKQKWQPDSAIGEQENHAYNDNIKRIITNENVRKKGLNLSISHSTSTFKGQLTTKEDGFPLTPPFHQRCIVGINHPPGNQHYIYADIKANANQALSAIFIDSLQCKELGQSVAPHEHSKSLYHSLALALEALPEFKKVSVNIIPTGVQSSPNDCQIFSISFALKAYKHEKLFSQWHARCLEKAMAYGEINSDDKKKNVSQNRADLNLESDFSEENHINSKLTITLGDKTSAYVYDYADSCYLLPADFFKHTHSTKLIDKVCTNLEKTIDACNSSDDKEKLKSNLEKILDIREKNWEERWEKEGESGGRHIKISQTKNIEKYLTSIEYKRRALILRTIETEEAKYTSTKPSL